MKSNLKNISKFLSYILRHHPESLDLEIDNQGWAHLSSLISKANKDGRNISEAQIREVMKKSSKKRFILSDDGHYIRAGYGHSINVDLELNPLRPPETLYHGTAQKNMESIRKNGLKPQNRQMVHLSAKREDALSVGGRHGKPIVLSIRAQTLYEDGMRFYQSDSEPGIWLVEHVPAPFILT